MQYLRYWSLRHSPFAAAPTFFYAAKTQRAAIAGIESLVVRQVPFGLMSAKQGCGATTLLHYLATASGFGSCAVEVFLTPGRQLKNTTPTDLLAWHFGVPRDRGAGSSVNHALARSAANGIHTVWLIDDCPSSALDAIKFFATERNGITIVAANSRAEVVEAGQDRVVLRPLTQSETREFIARSLEAAGRASKILDDSAIRLIHQLSGGRIKLISEIAEDALIFGCNHGLPKIAARQISQIRVSRRAA